jgi:hypothetical protein
MGFGNRWSTSCSVEHAAPGMLPSRQPPEGDLNSCRNRQHLHLLEHIETWACVIRENPLSSSTRTQSPLNAEVILHLLFKYVRWYAWDLLPLLLLSQEARISVAHIHQCLYYLLRRQPSDFLLLPEIHGVQLEE